MLRLGESLAFKILSPILDFIEQREAESFIQMEFLYRNKP